MTARVVSVEHDEQHGDCAIMDPENDWQCPDAPEWTVREYDEVMERVIPFPLCTSHMVDRLIGSGERFVTTQEDD